MCQPGRIGNFDFVDAEKCQADKRKSNPDPALAPEVSHQYMCQRQERQLSIDHQICRILYIRNENHPKTGSVNRFVPVNDGNYSEGYYVRGVHRSVLLACNVQSSAMVSRGEKVKGNYLNRLQFSIPTLRFPTLRRLKSYFVKTFPEGIVAINQSIGLFLYNMLYAYSHQKKITLRRRDSQRKQADKARPVDVLPSSVSKLESLDNGYGLDEMLQNANVAS
ncbi:hypothetical protein T05_848 [Trichinella murrelli]|uniref:Uncharacterized protein n=1 Tax=Trichinella murrelli TaxID=144512 RepID=A0A0V0UA20_9BILA|nr:hypothetical protein T05_848 [Trichinella murrelli]